MLILCALLAMVNIAVAQLDMPINEFDIKLIDDIAFRTHIKSYMDSVKQERQIQKAAGTVAGEAVNYVPVVGAVAKAAIQSITTRNVQQIWQDAFLSGISDATQHAIAVGKVEDLRASMNTILSHFHQLEYRTGYTDVDKRSISHIIHHEIMKMLSTFADSKSVFRSHPQVTIIPLGTLATIIAASYPILTEYVPAFQNDTLFIACELQDILIEYRRHLFYYRWQHLRYKFVYASFIVTISHLTDPMLNQTQNVLHRPYNAYGYNDSNDETVKCVKTTSCYLHFYCLKDIVTDQKYMSESNHQDSCLMGYLKVLRHRIEAAFQPFIDLMTDVCTPQLQSRRRNTGHGWLTIILNFGEADHLQDGDKKLCDTILGLNQMLSACDIFFRIYVDKKAVFNTTVGIEYANPYKNLATFFKVFTSEKIAKNADIRIELRDDDGGGDSELIVSSRPSIDKLLEKPEYTYAVGDARFSVSAYWRDEYRL